MPNLPTLILSTVIATLYAALYHLLSGRTMRQLFLDWASSLLGFAAGQIGATVLRLQDMRIGELHLLVATITSWLSMLFVRRLKL